MREPGSPDLPDYSDPLDWRTGRSEALGPGHGQVARVVVRDGLVGAGRVGALAFGALALGAFAIGALAIGRLVVRSLQLGRGEIRSLTNADLEVGTLRVGRISRLGEPEK
jgi:hypothetical protein